MKEKRISAKRMKYREAEIFLARLDSVYYEDVRGIFKKSKKPPVFQYCLSKFLSAARSVTWIMRRAYERLPGWEAWYQTKMPVENTELLNLFNQLRIRSEKIEAVIQ